MHPPAAVVSLTRTGAVALLLSGGATARAQPPCPNPPPVVVNASAVPADVCIPQGFPGNAVQFFDDYSWRAFVALVWPAAAGQRGVPDPTQGVGGSGPRVFETYKALWEVFHDDGTPPLPWSQSGDPNACGVKAGIGDLVLASYSKFSDLGQAGFGKLVGPLVAQNRTYVRYLTAYNQVEFDAIRGPAWFLRAKLPPTLTFPNASIDVKSAWMDMAGAKNPGRYYTRQAWVMDLATGKCAQKTVGLVGLHIVQKTPTRPQWIWSTFEQVDNVPPTPAGGPGTFAFNDGGSTPMPANNPYPLNPLPQPTPPPFNVTRVKPISPSTVKTNAAYQAALKSQGGGVWQYYQLVMTQWPTPGSTPANSGDPDHSIPGNGTDSTAFANTTLETFDQAFVFSGCMGCHTFTQKQTDFVWSLADHAYPPNVPNLLRAEQGHALVDVLERVKAANAAAQPQSKQPPQRRR